MATATNKQPVRQGESQADGSSAPYLPRGSSEPLVRLFRLLADDTRLRILHALQLHDEMNVRSLCELLGQSQPSVSHHLSLLRHERLLQCRRDGKHNYYRVVPERFDELFDVLRRVCPDSSSGSS